MQVITYLLIFPTNKINESQFLAKSFLEALLTCWHSQICKFQIYSFVFYCFVNFLCILLFLFLMYFIVFMIFFFCVILSWLISRYRKLCKWPWRQNKHYFSAFKKISNFHVFCTQTYAKCGFWANFGRRASTKRPVTSRRWSDFANLVSKDA